MIKHIQYFSIIKYWKDNKYCTCLSVIILDSIFVNSNKEYYLQISLEECKYAIKDMTDINKKPNIWLTYTIILLLLKYCFKFDFLLQWHKLRW